MSYVCQCRVGMVKVFIDLKKKMFFPEVLAPALATFALESCCPRMGKLTILATYKCVAFVSEAFGMS